MNEYKLLPGELALIKLTRGRWTLVDVSQLYTLLAYTWYAVQPKDKFYAATTIGGKLVYMHRFLLQHDKPHTDHISGDSLDNRLCNIRPATVSENNFNRQGERGIRRHKGKWQAYIQFEGKQHWKSFESKDDALAWREQMMKGFIVPPKSEQH